MASLINPGCLCWDADFSACCCEEISSYYAEKIVEAPAEISVSRVTERDRNGINTRASLPDFQPVSAPKD